MTTYKYIRVPVISKELHEEIKSHEGEGILDFARKVFPDETVEDWNFIWFVEGQADYRDRMTAHCINVDGDKLTTGVSLFNRIFDEPEPKIEVREVSSGIDKEMFLEALALSRCDDAAVALIRQRKGVTF